MRWPLDRTFLRKAGDEKRTQAETRERSTAITVAHCKGDR